MILSLAIHESNRKLSLWNKSVWRSALRHVTQGHAMYGNNLLGFYQNHSILCSADQWHALWRMGTSYRQQQRHVIIIHTERRLTMFTSWSACYGRGESARYSPPTPKAVSAEGDRGEASQVYSNQELNSLFPLPFLFILSPVSPLFAHPIWWPIVRDRCFWSIPPINCPFSPHIYNMGISLATFVSKQGT